MHLNFHGGPRGSERQFSQSCDRLLRENLLKKAKDLLIEALGNLWALYIPFLTHCLALLTAKQPLFLPSSTSSPNTWRVPTHLPSSTGSFVQRLRRKVAARPAGSAAAGPVEGLSVKIASYQSASGSHVTHFPVISSLALGDYSDSSHNSHSQASSDTEVKVLFLSSAGLLSVGGGSFPNPAVGVLVCCTFPHILIYSSWVKVLDVCGFETLGCKPMLGFAHHPHLRFFFEVLAACGLIELSAFVEGLPRSLLVFGDLNGGLQRWLLWLSAHAPCTTQGFTEAL